MKTRQWMFATGSLAVLVTGLLVQPAAAQSQQVTDPETVAKILKGFQISPVPINMQGKDPDLVGYGSYLVNAASNCDICHSAGTSTQFATGGNPYSGQHPAVVNPATYLGGGRDFGAFPNATGPHIISRNLTPDASGLPVGGDTLQQFMQTIRTGLDQDHVHPTCAGTPDGKCVPAPVDGDLLQIMPWPAYQSMSDFDLQAMFEYLSTIPCLEGGPGEPANRCGTGAKTIAVAGPKSATVSTRQFQLDGSQSSSFDGKPLSYAWTTAAGSTPVAGLAAGDTAKPTVQFGSRGLYTFQLTVTDSAGKSATDVASVNFAGN